MTQAIDVRPDRTQRRIAPFVPPLIHVASAELVECTCPDACERDHDRD